MSNETTKTPSSQFEQPRHRPQKSAARHVDTGCGRSTDANDYMVRNGAATAESLQRNHYPQATVADVAEALKAQKMFSSREWKRLYSDGTVVKWLQQVSDFFMTDAGATGSVKASEYFDPKLYLSTI